MKCTCPIWGDGYIDGKRAFRKSLGTRDMARARKKAAALESPDEIADSKQIGEAVKLFLAHCNSHGAKESSVRKYTATMNAFEGYCRQNGIEIVEEINVTVLDDYRVYRGVAPVTTKNELRLLRSFFKFSHARGWIQSNPAKEIPFPKVEITDKEPYTKSEFEAILCACDRIGHVDYERLRARAMLLTLRYTALRIGDVALLTRDRLSWDGRRWRIFVRTGKRGNPVFLPVPEEMKDALDRVPSRKSGSRYYFWSEAGSVRTLVGIANRVMRSVFKKSQVSKAHAHRFRHTLATELLEQGATCDEVADVLGNSPEMIRKYYGQWSAVRQNRIDDLMSKVHAKAIYQSKKLVRMK